MCIGALCSGAPAWAADAYEPNDIVGVEAGPLQDGIPVEGDLASRTDQDWFKLYTSAPTRLGVAVENVSAPAQPGACRGFVLEILDSNGKKPAHYGGEVRSSGAGAGGSFSFGTVDQGVQLDVVVTPLADEMCDPSLGVPAYRFRVEGALTNKRPEPTADLRKCTNAQSALRLARARLRAAERALRRAKTSAVRIRARRTLRVRDRQFGSARERVAIRCAH